MDPVVAVLQPGRQMLYLMLREPLVLGRECDGLVISDALVSRRHLELHARGGDVVVTDLGSSNGTFLDGERITASVVLRPGQTVRMGETAIRLAVAGEPPGPEAGRTTSISTIRTSEAPDLRSTSIDRVAELVTADPDPSRMGSDTVTVLFSDIESHTEHVAQLGDAAWFTVLDAHNRLIREELVGVGGREVKAQGDGFMLVFPSVRRALTFAERVQGRLVAQPLGDVAHPVRVRMGLHTGEAIADAAGDLFGRHVIKAARIANLAVGGQVLVSETVREIATGYDEFEFGAGEPAELKGLDGLHTVHELHHAAGAGTRSTLGR